MLIADGQPLLAHALELALGDHRDLAVVPDHPHYAIDLVGAVARHRPDVALLDTGLHEMDPPAVLRAVLAQAPDTVVIQIGWFHTPRDVSAAFAAGAVGFLGKDAGLEEVADAIRRARAGERPVLSAGLADLAGSLPPEPDAVAAGVAGLADLSPRELEVLHLLAAGLSVEQVALRLEITVWTVRTHIRNLLKKTATRSQAEAVGLARQHGFVL